MRIDISEQDKIRTGIAIDIRRKAALKKTGNKVYTIVHFIDGICSKQTYNRMAKGLPVKESERYDQILNRLNCKYNYDDRSVEQYVSQEIKLINCLRKDDSSAFFQHLRGVMKTLEKHKHCILEAILLQNLNIIAKFKSTRITNDEFQFLVYSYPTLDEKGKEITANFILYYVYHYQATKDTFEFVKRYIDFAALQEKFNHVRVLDIMIRFQNYYDASNYCEKLLTKYHNPSDATHFYCLIARLFLISQIQSESFEYYKQPLLAYDCIKNGIRTKYYYDYIHVLGLHAFTKNELEKAFSYFIIAVEDKRYFFPEIIYLYSIEGRTSLRLPTHLATPTPISELKETYDENWIVLYNYFLMKRNHVSPHELQSYIWDTCRFVVREFYPKQIVIDLLLTELKQLAKHTNNSQVLYQFNNYIKKLQP